MCSLAFSLKFNRKLTETLPLGLYVLMMLCYLLGITGHISHIKELLFLYESVGAALSLWCFIKEKKDIKAPFTDPGLAIFAILFMIIWFVSLHMRVTNFDDFHSWAITPKNIYAIDGVPTGGMASTFYRDYFPVVMYMDYLVFKLIGTYSESAMFAVVWWLMLVAALPYFHYRKNESILRYVCRAVMGVMIPFLMSFQFLHCLGVDIIVTMLFGSILVYLFEEENEDTDSFNYIRLIAAITVLGMLKTTSLIFAAVCIAVYFVRKLKPGNISSWLECALIPACTFVFWESWKVFCRVKGNSTYLSDNLAKNLDGGGSGMPEYAASTIKAFICKLFTYGLNDSKAGLTAFCMLVLFTAGFMLYWYTNGDKRRNLLSFITIICGMAGYLLVMIYIYLFVFEEWEALSLSSYDRYISTYFGAILYAGIFMIMICERLPVWIPPMLTLLLLCTVNYAFVSKTLIPSGYQAEYGKIIKEKEEIISEFLDAAGDPVRYGENIVIIDDSGEQLRAKVLPYAAVPGVVKLVIPDENGDLPTDEEIVETARNVGAERIVDLRRVNK